MTSKTMTWLALGGFALAGVGVFALANVSHGKTVDQEADELFPPAGVPTRNLPRGRRALHYERAVARCFYRELRQTHSADDAADIAKRALRGERGPLSEMAHVGRPVSAGCALLRDYYGPRQYQNA